MLIWLLSCAATPEITAPVAVAPKEPVATVLAPDPTAPSPVSPASPPALWPAPARLVAIGDLHGDVTSAMLALKLGGLVDDHGTWVGGTSWLVQTGDVLDRGRNGPSMLTFLGGLETEAAAAGGKVIVLDGNHELMNLQGDWRYVADFAEFPGATEEARTAARKAWMSPTGDGGKWVLSHGITVQIGDTVFVHGGIDSNWASHGIAGLNALAFADPRNAQSLVLGPDGPLWNRAYLLEDPVAICPELSRALATLGARRMVVGHTTQDSGRIATRCDGELYGIDTGISAYYGVHPSALVITHAAGQPDVVTALPTPGGG